MKKIILLLVLHFAITNAFCQTVIFREPFDSPNFPGAWKIKQGSWQIADLAQKRIKPPGGDNYFALAGTASGGNAEIEISIPIAPFKEPVTQFQLSFNYWAYSNPTGIIVSVDLLSDKGIVLSHTLGQNLLQKGKWDLFDQKFKVTNNVFYIRVTLVGLLSPITNSNIYFKNFVLSKK